MGTKVELGTLYLKMLLMKLLKMPGLRGVFENQIAKKFFPLSMKKLSPTLCMGFYAIAERKVQFSSFLYSKEAAPKIYFLVVEKS